MKQKQRQKRPRMVAQSSSMADLPCSILIEIISRLPIKTVMAIKCVCKSLLSVVSDSHFQTLHSTRAPTELMFIGCFEPSTTLSIAEYVGAKKNSVVSTHYCNFGAKLRFVNSCHGLVCFWGTYDNMFVVVCNPFTREFIIIPGMGRYVNIRYGLGFSPKDNCFKLLRLYCSENVGTDSIDEKVRLVGEIYTFGERASSWKRVANHPDVYLYELGLRDVIFHEGALHWYCVYEDAIVTFDLDTELFGKLVTPPRSPTGEFWCCSDVRRSLDIGVFDNCLYTTGCVGDYVDIWALKEYDQGSWVKIFSIQKDVKSLSGSYEPFKYLPNGNVLMFKNHPGIVCFNPNTGSVKNVGGNCRRNGSVFIRPSLVSLKVLLGDSMKIHNLEPWDPMKAATNSEDEDSQGCMAGSSAPMSSTEASTSTFHPTEQDGVDVGSFSSQVPSPPKDRSAGKSSSGIQKLADEIETLKAEDVRKGKVIAKLKKRKRKDRAFMRFMYQQLLNLNPNLPACPMSDDSSSSDDSD